jgi:predicted RNA binding protein YcfA (HicA-like mRNA interferase family)
MPGARAEEFRRLATKPGFQQIRQIGSHNDGGMPMEELSPSQGMVAAISVHPCFLRILRQIGIDQKQFETLR